MNENIDLTKILEGCPEGTEFYHTGFGKVWFSGIYLNLPYPINFRVSGTICKGAVTSAGTINKNYDGECVFFPSKDQRDWSKFERFWDKPKVEKFDPKTLQPFDKILARDSNNHIWECALLSHIDYLNEEYKVITVGSCYVWCIPYNEETKHLVGTTDDCPEFYKWWEE